MSAPEDSVPGGTPPSYKRFPSPRPPDLTLQQHPPVERKGSAGILRLDGNLRRRGSNEPTSPSPSADRLSVTFAMDDNASGGGGGSGGGSGRTSVTIAEEKKAKEGEVGREEVVAAEVHREDQGDVGDEEENESCATGMPEPPVIVTVTAERTENTELRPCEGEDEYTDSLMEIARKE